ncbi:hypothetical protein [Bradyrhizobium sp. Ash2021]|nr:hypothetical protein [Bradyrhizobium sp. Ash2021]WMT72662.1 hypothetical protein NL528_32280 [Bradyrhizobium sp. Ash2021]
MVDYLYNKHFDIYTGISYTTVADGFAVGYLTNGITTFVSGIKVAF